MGVRMKILIVAALFLLTPLAAVSAEKLSVLQEEAEADEAGAIKLVYSISNGQADAVAAIDIVVHRSLELVGVETGDGWAVVGKTAATAQLLPGMALRPGGRGRLTLTLKDRGDGPSIFQVRRPDPVFTLTTTYRNGEKDAQTVKPPFIRNMRKSR
jgi:hypothetical protein